jgi:hypothetical protein
MERAGHGDVHLSSQVLWKQKIGDSLFRPAQAKSKNSLPKLQEQKGLEVWVKG